MTNQTNGQIFTTLAMELMPNQDALHTIPAQAGQDSSFDDIAEAMYRERGYYVGGMAEVIAELCKRQEGEIVK